MSETTITAPPGTPFIEVTREFDAPAELLFRAYSEPELLVQWLGPRRLSMKVNQHEFHHGGAWRYVHTDEDGSEYGFHGVFHGEPSVAGITQTFEFEGAPGHVTLERVTFEERDGRTLLRMHSVHQSVEARDAHIEAGMEHGVNDSMERLTELLPTL
ncbi:SRPBCC family protein [Actinokineospora iranica]|uniref:Uncharacterized conserved protein YndB, AHSA1/START domain n=1 Tax=Actinokineospora iranica TaxID=1271860 RepID=A0A1G6KE09_9PSEU|nr:SRPBCC family protein [Actinokineospora iranica]SDC28546.1 Uncharacterized conserved protein YndB, AHSA1/START domain [Actinokineospora iranica]